MRNPDERTATGSNPVAAQKTTTTGDDSTPPRGNGQAGDVGLSVSGDDRHARIDPAGPGTTVNPDALRAALPEDVRVKRAWLNWKYTDTGDKLPFYPNPADPQKPWRHGDQNTPEDMAQMGTLEEALAKVSYGWGVGFAPRLGCGLTIFDVDAHATPEVLAFVEECMALTYVERSPGGKGVHVIFAGEHPTRKNLPIGFEVYGSSGFDTMTGAALNALPVAPLPDSVLEQITRFLDGARTSKGWAQGERVGKGARHGDMNAYLADLANVTQDEDTLYEAGMIRARKWYDDLDQVKRPVEETVRELAKYYAKLGWRGLYVANPIEIEALFPTGQLTPPVMGPDLARCGDLLTPIDPPAFLIDGILPKDVARVVGAGKVGKSTLLLHMMIHIILGRPWFDRAILDPGPVLLITAEDPTKIVKYRLQRILNAMELWGELTAEERHLVEQQLYIEDWGGKDKGRIAIVDQFGRPIEAPTVDNIIAAYSATGLRFTLLDPLSLLGPGERFVNDAEITVARIARKISDAFAAPTMINHHVSQTVALSGAAHQHAGRGGTAGADNSRAVWQIAPPPADAKEQPSEVRVALAAGKTILYLHIHEVSHARRPDAPMIIERDEFRFRLMSVSVPEASVQRGKTAEQRAAEREARDDATVLSYFQAGEVYPRKLFEKGVKGLTRDPTLVALARLVRDGRLTQVRVPPGLKGGHPANGYKLNPEMT